MFFKLQENINFCFNWQICGSGPISLNPDLYMWVCSIFALCAIWG